MMVKTKLKRLYKAYSQTLFFVHFKIFYYFSIILFIPNTYSLSNEGLILILINNKCNYKSLRKLNKSEF